MTARLRSVFVLILIFPVIAYSCKDDDGHGIPAYIYVEKFSISTDYETEGSARHYITDVWVHAENNLLGAWQLPAEIPILEDGDTRIELRAGVMQNGIANTRLLYPFFNATVSQESLAPGAVVTINPETGYRPATNFLWLEDFGNSGEVSLEIGPDSDVESFEVTEDPNEIYEGSGSFKGVVPGNNHVLEVISTDAFNVQLEHPVYLEVNFRNPGIPVIVGFYFIGGQSVFKTHHITLNPKDDWRKIYIHLNETLGSFTNSGDDFKIFFGAINESNSSKTFYLDNLKLLTLD